MNGPLLMETELPGKRASADAVRIICHRYFWPARHVTGKRVLEVCCGPGLGLGYLGRRTRSIVGGDITWTSLAMARRQYRQRVPLVRMDAHRLPFKEDAFDVILCVAAVIYLDVPLFLKEARRVLSKDGMLIINTPNKDVPGFRPSILGRAYHSIPEYTSLFREARFIPSYWGAFEGNRPGPPTAFSRVRKTVAGVLGHTGIYPVLRQAVLAWRGAPVLKPEIDENDMTAVRDIPVRSLPADRIDDRHRIIYMLCEQEP